MSQYLEFPGGDVADYVNTPDSAALDALTGDSEIRFRIAPDDWNDSGVILDKRATAGDEEKYIFLFTNATSLRADWAETGPTNRFGATSLNPNTVFTNGLAGWVKVTMDVDDGAANYAVNYFTSLDDTNDPAVVSWTAFGTASTGAATTDVLPSNATLKIGRHSDTTGFGAMAGKVYRLTIYDAIGGSVVAEFLADDFEVGDTGGATAVSSATGETWTLQGGVMIGADTNPNLLLLGVG